MPFHTLSAETVTALHSLILRRFSRLEGVRAPELVVSSLSAALTSFDGTELYPATLDKIAKITVSLVQRHPFFDGNKRTGCLILLLLLELNGFSLQGLSSSELEELMVAIGAGKVDEQDLSTRLKSRTHSASDAWHIA